MKKQVLYFAAGVFVTLLVFSFWAFKKDKADSGGGSYAVVDYTLGFSNSNKAKFVFPDGKTDEIKFKDKQFHECYAQILNQMESSGYSFVESNLKTSQGGTYGAFLIFRKK